MSLQYFEEKKIFLSKSFYLNIVCKNIVCDVGLKEKKNRLKTFDLSQLSFIVTISKKKKNADIKNSNFRFFDNDSRFAFNRRMLKKASYYIDKS